MSLLHTFESVKREQTITVDDYTVTALAVVAGEAIQSQCLFTGLYRY